jgi:hypothetical protein
VSAAAGGERQLERLDVTPLDGSDAGAGRVVHGDVVGELAQRQRRCINGRRSRRHR